MPTFFDGYVEKSVRVSSTCLVSVQRNRYSVPCKLVGRWISSRLYPNRIGVVAGDAVVACHYRLPDQGQVSRQHCPRLVFGFAAAPPAKRLQQRNFRHSGRTNWRLFVSRARVSMNSPTMMHKPAAGAPQDGDAGPVKRP